MNVLGLSTLENSSANALGSAICVIIYVKVQSDQRCKLTRTLVMSSRTGMVWVMVDLCE